MATGQFNIDFGDLLGGLGGSGAGAAAGGGLGALGGPLGALAGTALGGLFEAIFGGKSDVEKILEQLAGQNLAATQNIFSLKDDVLGEARQQRLDQQQVLDAILGAGGLNFQGILGSDAGRAAGFTDNDMAALERFTAGGSGGLGTHSLMPDMMFLNNLMQVGNLLNGVLAGTSGAPGQAAGMANLGRREDAAAFGSGLSDLLSSFLMDAITGDEGGFN